MSAHLRLSPISSVSSVHFFWIGLTHATFFSRFSGSIAPTLSHRLSAQKLRELLIWEGFVLAVRMFSTDVLILQGQNVTFLDFTPVICSMSILPIAVLPNFSMLSRAIKGSGFSSRCFIIHMIASRFSSRL